MYSRKNFLKKVLDKSGNPNNTTKREVITMYNHNITIQEYSDFLADMAEMNGCGYIPTEEEMDAMALDAELAGLLV